MYCFISKEIVFEQYTVMNGEPVYFVQEGCDTNIYLACIQYDIRHFELSVV